MLPCLLLFRVPASSGYSSWYVFIVYSQSTPALWKRSHLRPLSSWSDCGKKLVSLNRDIADRNTSATWPCEGQTFCVTAQEHVCVSHSEKESHVCLTLPRLLLPTSLTFHWEKPHERHSAAPRRSCNEAYRNLFWSTQQKGLLRIDERWAHSNETSVLASRHKSFHSIRESEIVIKLWIGPWALIDLLNRGDLGMILYFDYIFLLTICGRCLSSQNLPLVYIIISSCFASFSSSRMHSTHWSLLLGSAWW